MDEAIKAKRTELELELRRGQVVLQQQMQAVQATRETLTRIQGAIAVLRELQPEDEGAEAPSNGKGNVMALPTAKQAN